MFEGGDPELIALTLNDVARAEGLVHDALTAQSDIASAIRTLKALGLEMTAKRLSCALKNRICNVGKFL